jgi:alkanesulfonate monooxygenase SsuD/methylene tetrahydromethanopterin reductase-like flavin-dependent oxidoreductase (luciferase family)
MSTINRRRIAFGTSPGAVAGPEELVANAQEAERLGFDLLTLSDHLHSERPTYDPWTALTWVLAATSTLEVAPVVLGLPYRHPAVTAKMAETLSRLSGHRLVLGLGGGGFDHEFAAFGLAQWSAGEKVTAQREAITIIRRLWQEPSVSFEGQIYRTEGARIEPRPTHPIPIWLGSYGPRALRMTGELADGWIPSLPRLRFDEALAMREMVRSSAREAGRDPDEITCAANLAVRFDPSATPDASRIFGPPEAIAETLVGIARAGFTVLHVGLPGSEDRERFVAEVAPLVRRELGIVPSAGQ